MKKLAFILSLGLSFGLQAQTVEDVELFHHRDLNGSPRFTAMGGAFTALGNDPSAIGINPASGAVNQFSNISFSLGFNNETSSFSDFYDKSSSTLNFDLSFENFGLNLSLGEDRDNRFSLAVSVNRLASFNRDFSILGAQNDYTLGQYWAESSAGTNVNLISDDAYAAWDAYILVSDSNDNILADGTGFAYGEVIDGQLVANSELNYTFNQNGSANETNIAFALERGGKLYYGFSLGFPTLTYRREEFFTENLQNVSTAPYSATQYTFRRLNDISATGFNFKLGLIYAPVPQFRLGLSYQSNSWYTINQFYETDIAARFAEAPYPGISTSTASATLSTDQYQYRLRTPGIVRLGLASVLAKQLILSVDWQYQNASGNRLYTNFNSFNIDENVLRSEFQPALDNFFRNGRQTWAAGLEWRLDNFFLRGGYRLDQSMYRSDLQASTLGDRQDISAGFGFQSNQWGLNLTVINTIYNRNQVLYRGFDPQSGDPIEVLQDLALENNLLRFNAGVTYKF